nr:ADP-ribosylglycohydrolase family protein [uncultured Cellulosilyticum sp.]
MKNKLKYFEGCILGGAIGDALGAPVEFRRYEQIVEEYGEEGVTELIAPPGETEALITDDTQMTMFTIEGILRSVARAKRKDIPWDKKDITHTMFRAYLRWVYTQGLKTPHWSEKDYDGALVKMKRLHAYREAGITSITALGKGIKGSVAHPINDSKGCGGLMRVAPLGLVTLREDPFEIGCEVAAITHGGPCAYLPAGALVMIIRQIIEGKEIEEAVRESILRLKLEDEGEESADILEKAITLAQERECTREKIESLGEGIFAHEALAMAVYVVISSMKHSEGQAVNIKEALCMSVNHSGGSDIVGAITGQLLGAYYGVEVFENLFKVHVELEKEIRQLAQDLYTLYDSGEKWAEKYPAW